MQGKYWIAMMLAATVLGTGCTTINPYTREEQTAKATQGAAIGAAAGAVVGLLSGDDSRDRRKRALIGAGVGALAGGSIGYYMDVQEARLRQQLEGTGVSVTRQGNEIILNMPGNVTFDVDQAAIRPEFGPILESVALVLDEYDQTLVEVVGHTDSTGGQNYNQLLSERRADAVGDFLVRSGVMPRRVAVAGYGELYPVASNATAPGRQANRRVELTLVPLTATG
ncbi:MAG: OmpA family protein [Xanthomonadales bacterium]|nr:OmpA family protein [Xanthomonadales bacterium]